MGGRGLADTLRAVGAQAVADTAVVEAGAWLGASAAQLALGLRDAGRLDDVAIHLFDRWRASAQEVAKARRGGLDVDEGDDLLPHTRRHLALFGADVRFHQGDLLQARWDGTPISVYVDDAAKTPIPFFHVLRTFGPSWIPGATIVVLMDFFYFEKKRAGARLFRCQRDFVEAHPGSFRPWGASERPHRGKSGAVFVYERAIDFSTATDTPAARRLIRAEHRARHLERATSALRRRAR